MTGHNHMARHNHIVDVEADAICRLCDYNYVQDTEHIMAECPYFLGLRLDLFHQCLLTPPFNGLPIVKVLAFLHQSNLLALEWKSS